MIIFDSVTKQFPDGTIAFQDLSFEIDEGEMALITGPSGAGKTTIMRLLIREYVPTQGKIIFENQPIHKLKNREIPLHRRKIGVVFQDYKLIEELNVWENIALPLYIRRKPQQEIEERITDLLKLVELPHKALMFPKQLSGGEAQRISIARALATGPRVIFADEPTGNLDETTGKHIIQLLKKINQLGTTLLVATHDPAVMNQLKVKTIDLTKYRPSKSKTDNQNKTDSKKENKKDETEQVAKETLPDSNQKPKKQSKGLLSWVQKLAPTKNNNKTEKTQSKKTKQKKSTQNKEDKI
jgi:cell division transport system ATP-binding protein